MLRNNLTAFFSVRALTVALVTGMLVNRRVQTCGIFRAIVL